MESATYVFSFEDRFTFCRDGNNSVMDVSCSKTEPEGEHAVSSPVSAAMGSVLVAVKGRSWPSMTVCVTPNPIQYAAVDINRQTDR